MSFINSVLNMSNEYKTLLLTILNLTLFRPIIAPLTAETDEKRVIFIDILIVLSKDHRYLFEGII